MPARLTTGAVLAAVVAAVLVALVYGCGVVGGGEPEEADTPPCDSPTVTDLGVPFGARVASFTFSGGEVFVEVSDLTQDTPLGDVTRTRIDLGPADRPPTPDPQGSSRMVGTEHQVSVELGLRRTIAWFRSHMERLEAAERPTDNVRTMATAT